MGIRFEQDRTSEATRHRGAVSGHLRDAWVALMSALVVSLLIAYVFAAPTAELTASVGPPVPRPGPTAVVQGRVLEADGGGLEGAQIEVRGGGKETGDVSADDGRFRVELRGRCTSYLISLQVDAAGSPVETESQRRICPGDAVPVVARVVTHGHFIWVPGPR